MTPSPDFAADVGRRSDIATDARKVRWIAPQQEPETGIVAVQLSPSDGQRLFFAADPSRPAPDGFPDAVDQFVELMRAAVRRGYVPATISFADLRRFYDGIVATFEWPEISDKRLSMLLEQMGCLKTVNRDRRGGKDKRAVAFVIPARQIMKVAA